MWRDYITGAQHQPILMFQNANACTDSLRQLTDRHNMPIKKPESAKQSD